ncbi:cyclic nucleotide-binding domain-containing protein [Oryzifoliimicrobium ureilyticus]|uniref:cyclic nucleotide-binding domain-containing protein n=1 Tax=Oryzifoliimicrobium ureilyticus TaxID=3113724 RepID=UPI003076298A
MALADDINLLAQIPLFSGMSDDQLRLIAFGADRRFVPEGQLLFREGSPAESAYVVVDGQIELSRLNRSGDSVVDMVVGRGALLSELALITFVERKYTALAVRDCGVLRLTRPLFHRLIEEYPSTAEIIANRIRDNIAALAAKAAAELHRFT